MKKLLLLLTIVLFASFAMAATVDRSMSTRVMPNTQQTVTLSLTGVQSQGTQMAIEDTIPQGVTFLDWNIVGASESKEDITFRQDGNNVAWAYTPTGTTVTITYNVQMPNQERTYTFGPLVWFDRSGMSPADAGITNVLVTSQTTTTTQQTTTTTTIQETTTPEEIIEEETTTPEEIIEEETSNLWMFIILGLLVAGLIVYLIFKKKD